MKSPQEVLLRAISDSSIGADFVFEPNEYRKGNALREPADLVWACNGCIILMYMTERKHKKRAPEAHAQMREALIRHNLSQAKGWLSEWRHGKETLSGKSITNNFNIKHDDYKYIIILSVIECGDSEATYHGSATRSLNVTACLTMPHNALLKLMQAGGTLVDILIMSLSIINGGIKLNSNIDALNLSDRHIRISAEQTPILPEGYEHPAPTLGTYEIVQNLIKIRIANNSMKNNELNDDYKPLNSIFNDLLLSDLYSIVNAIDAGMHRAGPNSEKTITMYSKGVSKYHTITQVSTIFNNDKFLENTAPSEMLIEKLSNDPDSRGMIKILWESRANAPLGFFYEMDNSNLPSLTEEVCQSIDEVVKNNPN